MKFGDDEKTKYGPDRTALMNKGSEENATRKRITDERYDKMKNHNGDAMHEVIGTGYSYYGVRTTASGYNWMLKLEGGTEAGTGYYNGDYALIGNCALSFVLRGGYWSEEKGTGVFALDDNDGLPFNSNGFRPVIVV